MPNKIYIQILNKEVVNIIKEQDEVIKGVKTGKKIKVITGRETVNDNQDIMVFPLKDDITIEAKSEMSSWSDMIPGLDTLNTIQSVMVGVSGEANASLLDITNMFDAPRWKKTEPIRFTVSLGFYTVTDSYKDVYKPMRDLISLSILSTSKSGNFMPPGIFLPSASKVQGKKQEGEAEAGTASKLIAIKIPGVIFMNLAMIESANPVFSKHLTESGYPLWGTLELSIMGLYPANDKMFNGGRMTPKSAIGSTVKTKAR